MQRITDVSPAEWRWVIIFSGLLVALTLLPYAWAFASDTPNNDWQFMGMLPNPQDGATYLSKIGEGARGQWLFTLNYSPDLNGGAAINEFYLVLGHLSRLLGLSALLTYHLTRIATGFAMYITIYHLGATIWHRLRARRLFFGLMAVGSGLGWLVALFIPTLRPSDLYVPESIPLYSAFVNPHFPLSIALVALLASMFVVVFRPGYTTTPTWTNGGPTVVLITVVLALTQPQAWLPIAITLCVYLVIHALRTRRVPPVYALQWVGLAVLPALPIIFYDLIVVNSNPLFQSWNAQNITPSGSPLNYIFGFGLLLLVAIPGLIRALRHFEQDGDRFMLVWFVTNALLLYAPFNLQRRLVIGMIIPIVYFAVRALEDYWFYRISPKWRDAFLVALFVFIVPSNVFALLLPLVGVAQPKAGIDNNQLLPADYGAAISWLREHTGSESVVLAPPAPSLWIPAYTPAHIIYGHPYETVDAAQRLREVQNWYSGENCGDLLTKYHVEYVLVGPVQAAKNAVPGADNTTASMGNTPCAQVLSTPIITFGSVAIYAAHP